MSRSQDRLLLGMTLALMVGLVMYAYNGGPSIGLREQNAPPTSPTSTAEGIGANRVTATSPVPRTVAHRPEARVTSHGAPSAAVDDSTAASQRFRTLAGCERLVAAKRQAQVELSSPPRMDRQQSLSSDTVLARISEQLREYEPRCKDLSDEALSASIYPAMLEAANGGDAAAARCFVAAIYDPPKDVTEEQVSAYKADAMRLAEDGVRHGDWGMVAMLAMQYSDSPRYGPFGSFAEPDPAKAYAYTKLQALGATGDFALSRIAALDAIAGQANLTSAQLTAADKWAEEMYRQYFRGSKLQAPPPLCDAPGAE